MSSSNRKLSVGAIAVCFTVSLIAAWTLKPESLRSKIVNANIKLSPLGGSPDHYVYNVSQLDRDRLKKVLLDSGYTMIKFTKNKQSFHSYEKMNKQFFFIRRLQRVQFYWPDTDQVEFYPDLK